MEKIELQNVLPRVFAERGARDSEVWLRELTLSRGRSYLLAAESGAGKSSLCQYLTGCRSDYLGSIGFDGHGIDGLSEAQWCETRRRHIAYLPQELHLFPELTAIENVEIKNRLTGFRSRQDILRLFDALGVADRAGYPAGRISIGQQQRVALIRALCQPFDFLLLDEPVSHLDEACNSAVAQVVEEEARRQGAGIIATSVGNNIKLTFDKTYSL